MSFQFPVGGLFSVTEVLIFCTSSTFISPNQTIVLCIQSLPESQTFFTGSTFLNLLARFCTLLRNVRPSISKCFSFLHQLFSAPDCHLTAGRSWIRKVFKPFVCMHKLSPGIPVFTTREKPCWVRFVYKCLYLSVLSCDGPPLLLTAADRQQHLGGFQMKG